jgi:hypothetical protein
MRIRNVLVVGSVTRIHHQNIASRGGAIAGRRCLYQERQLDPGAPGRDHGAHEALPDLRASYSVEHGA